jgi:hypothetical protein
LADVCWSRDIVLRGGPGLFKSGPFAYHGLLAFYLPVIIWGAYLVLTTFYMMKELKRAPDRTQSPAPASSANKS